MMRAALYARTSTADQHVDAQLDALRAFCQARGWRTFGTFVDDGISGARARRPQLDRLVDVARLGRVDVVVAWRVDRLGRSVRDLVLLVDELQQHGCQVATVHDGIDMTTAGGRLTMHMMAALAEWERTLIRDRVNLGLARARKKGVRLGRPPSPVTAAQLADVSTLSLSAAARQFGVSKAAVWKWRKKARAAPL